jgi:hypothetical protein
MNRVLSQGFGRETWRKETNRKTQGMVENIIKHGSHKVKVKFTLELTDISQYVLVSSPLWDLWSDVTSCIKVSVWKLLSHIYGAPSLTRGRVCSLQCNHSMARVGITRNHTLLSHLSTRFPYLYPLGTGWPSYTPRHWVPFTSPLTTRRAMVEIF